MNISKRLQAAFGAAIIASALSGGVCAAPLYSIGVGTTSSFTLDYDATPPTMSAVVAITVNSAAATQLDLSFVVTNDTVVPNTTSAGTLTQASLMAIGMDFTPNVTGASWVTTCSVFDGLVASANGINFPGGFKVDLCVYAANNCQGGDVKDGLLVDTSGNNNGPKSDSFRLLLTRASSDLDWTVNLSSVKMQTNLGSYEFGGCIRGSTDCGGGPPNKIPEPESLSLVSLAAICGGLVMMRRRGKAKA
jgi:hypothetical protein